MWLIRKGLISARSCAIHTQEACSGKAAEEVTERKVRGKANKEKHLEYHTKTLSLHTNLFIIHHFRFYISQHTNFTEYCLDLVNKFRGRDL